MMPNGPTMNSASTIPPPLDIGAALTAVRCSCAHGSVQSAFRRGIDGDMAMHMKLRGSCQCGKVAFDVDSDTPYPFMFCYCSICRKTTGAVTSNVMGKRATLKVRGRKHLRVHHAVMRARGRRPMRSEGERWFCALCGTHH